MESAMNPPVQAQPTATGRDDERIWAALAHGSVFLMFLGPIIPVILWFTHRKKSSYVAFQALQAMIYQSLFFWAWFTIIPLVMMILLFVVVGVVVAVAPRADNSMLVGVVPQLLMWTFIMFAMLFYWLGGIVGAVLSLMGRDVRYPFFGNRLARYLQYDGSPQATIADEPEERVVAAVAHSTCILLIFGIATPIAVWITQHERSMFLRFQAMQASIYQGLGAVAYFVGMGLYMLSMVALMAVVFVASAGNHSSSAGLAWVGLGFLPLLGIVCVFALGVPLYHLFGFIASVRVLRGHDYRYPILGKLLARRMKSDEAAK